MFLQEPATAEAAQFLALGARPDRELVADAPHDVAAAIEFGRPPMQ